MTEKFAVEFIHREIRDAEAWPQTGDRTEILIDEKHWELVKVYSEGCIDYYNSLYPGLTEEEDQKDFEWNIDKKWEDNRTFLMECPFYGSLRFRFLKTEELKLAEKKRIIDLFSRYDLASETSDNLKRTIYEKRLTENFHLWKADQIRRVREEMHNLFTPGHGKED